MSSPPDPAAPLLRLRAVGNARIGPIDLDLGRGECVAIMGASGAGKSLLLRQIADLDPGTGAITLAGAARERMPAAQWRRRVLYCAAEPGWWDESVAPHFAGQERRAAPLMQRFGLDEGLLGQPVHTLSTGERQRLGLVRALLAEPQVLLLDEPTAALDASVAAQVEAVLLHRLASGMAIVLVTHGIEQARRLASAGYRLAQGVLEPLWG